MNREAERVLTNWLEEALSSQGKLNEGISAAKWIAERFLKWYEDSIEDDIAQAELALYSIRTQLMTLGGWSSPEIVEVLHELVHADEALARIRLAIDSNETDSPQ